jgi:PhoH-like ATPase
MELIKTFVLDTNVLLFDPHAIFKFSGNNIVIPITVIEEVDRFKREMSENGRHARLLSRLIDDMRSHGELSKGVALPSGGLLRVELGSYYELPVDLPLDKADNRILAVVLGIKHQNPDHSVILITKDANLRIKADALSMSSQDYEPSNVDPESLYPGTATVFAPSEWIDEFYLTKQLAIWDEALDFHHNQYFVIKDEHNPNHNALGRYQKKEKKVVALSKPIDGLWGVIPRNAEQCFVIDALLDDSLKLVSLVGKAGTGKTLLAIAAGLVKTVDEGVFRRLLVSRPVFPLGKDIGFLPGSVEEKLNPWMQPIFDNIDFLFGQTGGELKSRRGASKGCQELINQGLLQIEPLTYIRGRSIPKQYMVIDEAQNLTPHEIKTIVTRAGDDTKIVLTGDSFQIDNPYIDSANNGLVYLVERFKDQQISAHISLQKGERSVLSELASNLL